MKQIKSVITKKITDIYSAPDLKTAKQLFTELLNECNINDTDKENMLLEAGKVTTLVALQFYATNCMFKFEGLGVS